jgi:hypothetical protein
LPNSTALTLVNDQLSWDEGMCGGLLRGHLSLAKPLAYRVEQKWAIGV